MELTAFSLSSCRICLEKNAIIPLFDGDNNPTLMLFNDCFNEKLEYVPELPGLLCSKCYTTIQTTAEFIAKYRSNQQTLQNSIKAIKQEYIDEDDFYYAELEPNQDSIYFLNDNTLENVKLNNYEVENIDVQKEPTDKKGNKKHIKLVKLIELKNNETQQYKTKIKEEKGSEILFKDKPDLTIVKTETKSNMRSAKTNRISSSLLEGAFLWNGEKWCVSSNKYKNTWVKVKKEKEIKKLKVNKREKRPYLCDLCGTEFKNSYNFSKHWRRKHETPVPINCTICSKTYASVENYKRHMSIHSNEKHICEICSRIFNQKRLLISHIRCVHEGIKTIREKTRYPCKLCDKTFSLRKLVVMHIRSVHTGERPEKCTVCSNTFTHKDYLKEHMRLHTGETPYKCPVCNRGYAQRCNMKSHIVHNHRISQLDPELLSKIKPCYTRLMKP